MVFHLFVSYLWRTELLLYLTCIGTQKQRPTRNFHTAKWTVCCDFWWC